jgi:AraC-like DNA-binding protein
MRLVSDAAQIEREEVDGAVRVRFNLFGGREPIPRQRMEFDLLTILTFCRWVSGRPIAPLAVTLVWPPPADLEPFMAAYQCPLCFEAAFNGLIFTPADLDAPLPAFNPLVAGLHHGLVQQRLAAFDGASLSVRIREEIARRISEGEPRRERIAQSLNMSDRTMQRRLRDENSSFEKLLDSTRCDLAQHYLAHPNLSLAEVAYLLGFADQSAFFRACKRWFDASPRQFRRQLFESAKHAPAERDATASVAAVNPASPQSQ